MKRRLFYTDNVAARRSDAPTAEPAVAVREEGAQRRCQQGREARDEAEADTILDAAAAGSGAEAADMRPLGDGQHMRALEEMLSGLERADGEIVLVDGQDAGQQRPAAAERRPQRDRLDRLSEKRLRRRHAPAKELIVDAGRRGHALPYQRRRRRHDRGMDEARRPQKRNSYSSRHFTVPSGMPGVRPKR